jgi:hypothetical protein
VESEPVTTQSNDGAPLRDAASAGLLVSTADAVRDIVRRYRETFERLGR